MRLQGLIIAMVILFVAVRSSKSNGPQNPLASRALREHTTLHSCLSVGVEPRCLWLQGLIMAMVISFVAVGSSKTNGPHEPSWDPCPPSENQHNQFWKVPSSEFRVPTQSNLESSEFRVPNSEIQHTQIWKIPSSECRVPRSNTLKSGKFRIPNSEPPKTK